MLTPRQRIHIDGPPIPAALADHANFAVAGCEGSRLEISKLMFKHQLKLADRSAGWPSFRSESRTGS